MATDNATENNPGSTNPEQYEELKISVAGPLYRFIDDADPSDAHDQLTARLQQLDAMLTMAGRGIESRSDGSLTTEEISAYFWNCSLLVQECEQLVNRVAVGDAGRTSEQPSPHPIPALCGHGNLFDLAQDALVDILSLAQCAFDSIAVSDIHDERVAAASQLLVHIIRRARDYDLDGSSHENARVR